MKEYLFASQDQEAEYKRLCLIQDSFDEKSQKHLLQAGLREGYDCLEVGLGAGSMASWMKARVGGSGSVLGVDLNTDFIAENVDYELLEGDILTLDIKRSFDIIHLRYVLIHNKNSQEILQRLYGLLKPGGKLVIEEPDFTLAKWMDAKSLESCRRVNSAICRMFEKKGLKAHFGSTVHLSLEEAGFGIDENRSYLHLCSGNETVARVMASSVRALEKRYLETGLCSNEDIEGYIQACEDPESLGVYYATVAVTALKKETDAVAMSVAEEPARADGIYIARSQAEILQCFELMQTLRPHLTREGFAEQVNRQIAEGYFLFYRYQSSEVVALAGCRLGLNLAWGRHLYIDDLVTSVDRRSEGHGQALLDYLIGFAREKECGQIHLDSSVQRFGAHKFYLREDFKIASHHFSKEVSPL